MTGILPAPQHR